MAQSTYTGQDFLDALEDFSGANDNLESAAFKLEVRIDHFKETKDYHRLDKGINELTGALTEMCDEFRKVNRILSGTSSTVDMDPHDIITSGSVRVRGISRLEGVVKGIHKLASEFENYPHNVDFEGVDYSIICPAVAGFYSPQNVNEEWVQLGYTYEKIANNEVLLRAQPTAGRTPVQRLYDEDNEFYRSQATVIESQMSPETVAD